MPPANPLPPTSPLPHYQSRLQALTAALNRTTSPTATADTLDQIRRHLPSADASYNPAPLADAAASVLRQNPSNLLLAHRAVAVLAHPTLCGARPRVESAVVAAMDRLAMSSAFQHTAMAALQNAAGAPSDRDVVVLAVVAAMRQHHVQNGVLLRGADLIAFHLNQTTAAPLTSSYRVASSIIVDSIDKLSTTPQGASTALLALVATARHISSLASFGSRPSTAARFSRGSIASAIVDHQFAYAVVLAMARHKTYAPVQVLGCEVIRVAAAGATAVSRQAAKELYAAAAGSAVVAALQAHSADVSVVDRALVALRALLLGGGFHGRAVKPSLNVELEFARFVATVAERLSDSIVAKDRDLSSAAAVLAADVRAAVSAAGPGRRERGPDVGRFAEFGKRIMRRIRFGHKLDFYENEYDRYADGNFTDSGPDIVRPAKDFSQVRPRRGGMGARSSFSIMQAPANRRGISNHDMKETGPPSAGMTKANRKNSEGVAVSDNRDTDQIAVNRKWRSVSGRWNQRGRRGSTVSTNVDGNHGAGGTTGSTTCSSTTSRGNTTNSRRERRGPLTLSGSEMANLTRQPSRIFAGGGEAGLLTRRRDARAVDNRMAFVSDKRQDDFGF